MALYVGNFHRDVGGISLSLDFGAEALMVAQVIILYVFGSDDDDVLFHAKGLRISGPGLNCGSRGVLMHSLSVDYEAHPSQEASYFLSAA